MRDAQDAESLGELSATTEQLALVATLCQRADDARTPRLGTPAVLLERASDELPNEFRARNPTLPGSSGEQPIVRQGERNPWSSSWKAPWSDVARRNCYLLW
jgi:hypothetical protein